MDGVNRWRACRALGITPKTVEYRGDNALGYVVSANLAGRHLDESQRAMIAAKIAILKHGGDRTKQEQNLSLCSTAAGSST